MRVRILYHDNCFDGAASSALFTAFYEKYIDKGAQFQYVGMSHGPGDVFAGAFEAEPAADLQHACLDFRYSPDPRLTWWFDHHQSAFLTEEDAQLFQSRHNPRHFYDPAARSCSKFLADRCIEKFGFDPKPYQELIRWADIIDGAQFESPQAAVELHEPALMLMTWVEANRDPALKVRFIEDLKTRGIPAIAAEDYVQQALRPLLEAQKHSIELIRHRARCEGGVVTFDISDEQMNAANKFIPYYLYPDCHYVVGVTAAPGRAKISVGSNPWYPARRSANIASICSRHGGGGHPVVGAISLPLQQLDRARTLAAEIAAELRDAASHEG
jgi:hypothetical protein